MTHFPLIDDDSSLCSFGNDSLVISLESPFHIALGMSPVNNADLSLTHFKTSSVVETKIGQHQQHHLKKCPMDTFGIMPSLTQDLHPDPLPPPEPPPAMTSAILVTSLMIVHVVSIHFMGRSNKSIIL